MKAALYARVSTDDQKKGFSIPTQVRACRDYAEQHDYTVVATFEEDYSGAYLDRPELEKLRRLVAEGALDVIVVYDLDRLTRKAGHRYLLEEEFQAAGVRVEYVLGGYQDTAEGEFQKQIRAAVAEYEREKIKERCTRGKKALVEAGHVLIGNIPPFGYTYVHRDGSTRGHLLIDEEEAHIVRLIYQWYVYGDEKGKRLGMLAIALRLSSMGIVTKRAKQGQKKIKRDPTVWSSASVDHILDNEIYAGTWYYNRLRRVGNKYIQRDQSEWIPVPVPAIVDRALWEAAQRVKVENRRFARRNLKHDYLLRARLHCAVCGCQFRCYGETDKRFRYYYCAGQRLDCSVDYKSLTCSRSLRQDVIDERVWAQVKDILLNPDLILDALRHRQVEADREAETLRTRLAAIEKRLEALDTQQAKLLRVYLQDDTPVTELMFGETLAAIKKEREGLQHDADDLRSRLSTTVVSDSTIDQVRAFCQRAQQGIEAFTFEDKVAAIEALNIKGVVTRGEKAEDDVIVLSGYLSLAEDAEGGIASPTSRG